MVKLGFYHFISRYDDKYPSSYNLERQLHKYIIVKYTLGNK